MSYWSNHPFLRIISIFAFGILTARYVIPIDPTAVLYLILSVLTSAILIKIVFKNKSKTIVGNLLLVAVFFIGFYHYQRSNDLDNKFSIKSEWNSCHASIGIITSFPTEKDKYIVHQVDLTVGIQDSSFLNLPVNLLLYEKKLDGQPSKLQYGDKIKITGSPVIIEGPKNPHEFDFSKHMSDQHIFLQQFVEPDQIELIRSHQANEFMSAVYRIRNYFENIIKTQIIGENEKAIVLALLLGIKGQLDPEIKTAYAAAGAMHVLAVSGLHVSIIYFILNWFFRGIPAGDFKRFATPSISIVALWVYALLTGFSPSILRAVSMFTIIIFAKILSRKSQVFNSLAFAAFILLLFDPMFLFNIGFQLSFLAVAGIVYIYPKLYKIWSIQNPIGDYFWKLTCVSIAAQVATFPLSLYYFHQFPSYFLIANLVVIPAAFAIMILGLTMLILGSLTHKVGWVLEKTVYFMNWFVEKISEIDGSVLDWIQITSIQTILIYLAVLAFFAFIKYKRLSYAWVIVIAIIGFSTDRTWTVINQSKSNKLIFYSTRKTQIIDEIEKFDAKLYTLDSLVELQNQKRYITPYRIHHLLQPPGEIQLISDGLADFAKIKIFKEKRVLFLTQHFDPDKIQFRLQTDIVVISNQSVDSLSILDQIVDFEEIILDNTNSRYYANRIKSEAKSLEMKLISLHDQAHQISLSRDQKLLDMLF